MMYYISKKVRLPDFALRLEPLLILFSGSTIEDVVEAVVALL